MSADGSPGVPAFGGASGVPGVGLSAGVVGGFWSGAAWPLSTTGAVTLAGEGVPPGGVAAGFGVPASAAAAGRRHDGRIFLSSRHARRQEGLSPKQSGGKCSSHRRGVGLLGRPVHRFL
ncbi:MAG: hypothetical protein WDN28_06140 [Chthoniobacter sp.]